MNTDWVLQLYEFCAFVFLGCLLSGSYKVVERLFSLVKSKAVSFVVDCVFAVVAVVAVVLFDIRFVSGRFRLFYALGLTVGAFVFALTFYAPLDKLFVFLYNSFKRKNDDERNS